MLHAKQLIWFIPEEFPNGQLLVTVPVVRGWMGGFRQYGGGDFLKNYYVEFENFYVRMAWVTDEFARASRYIAEKMIENPAWAENLNRQCIAFSKKAEQLAKQNLRENLIQLPTTRLVKRYQELASLRQKQHVIGAIISWTNDAVHEYFSGRIRAMIERAVQRVKLHVNLTEAFSILTTPMQSSYAEQEELAIIALAREFKKKSRAAALLKAADDFESFDDTLKKLNPSLWRAIDRIWFNYCWLVYVYMGPANAKAYYYGIIQSMLKQNVDLNELVREIKKRRLTTKRAQEQTVCKLKLTPSEYRVIALARAVVWLKAFRKDIFSLILYSHEALFRELGKRYALSVKQLWMCLPEEINPLFLAKRNISDILNERVRHCLLFYEDGKEKLYTGQEISKILSRLRYQETVVKEANELVGSCAYPGKARGAVKIINQASEMGKMKKGDILVSLATTPSLVPVMKLAAAIVTNTGGLTCHAAIVSRELKIPCVVGAKIATKVFKDGDLVEVDAERGIVRKLDKQ